MECASGVPQVIPFHKGRFKCKCCNCDEIEDWLYLQIEYNNTHLLDGVVHSNGYGHLLTLNGREDTPFETIKDLLCFLLTLISKLHKPLMTRTSEELTNTNTCNVLCAWKRNVENVQEATINVLLGSRASREEK
ncbi:PHD finger protein [Spatholobus suberectus]|nr:PHD finger protein [Spatholobus suberectus]